MLHPESTQICIGSFPHSDTKFIVDYLLDHKFYMWPQLPNRAFQESMYVQYSEGLPGAVIDEKERKIFFQSAEKAPEEFESFFENVASENYEPFKISSKFSAGLDYFLNQSDRIAKEKPQFIKGQITGPISYALTVTDEEKKSLYFDPSMREIIFLGLKMKAIAQIRTLKQLHKEILFFIDEPYLSGIGSGIFALDLKETFGELKQFIQDLRDIEPDVTFAVHCCGNTDWGLLASCKPDIISFDAFNYGESLLFYETALKEFLADGGSIAWGAVPTSGNFREVTLEHILAKMEEIFSKLEERGFERKAILRNSFFSPACGTGSLTESDAYRVLELLNEVANKFQSELK